MGEFVKGQLPDTLTYCEWVDLPLKGRGEWRTTRCDFHGGSDSMRINVRTGGFVCMNCGAKGGDVLAHYMRLKDVEFVEAARRLGAYVDDGKPHRGIRKPGALPLRDVIGQMVLDARVLALLYLDAISGRPISESDRERGIEAARNVDAVGSEFAK